MKIDIYTIITYMKWLQVITEHLAVIISPCKNIIRHINLTMFDVIGDKPEGVARGVYHV